MGYPYTAGPSSEGPLLRVSKHKIAYLDSASAASTVYLIDITAKLPNDPRYDDPASLLVILPNNEPMGERGGRGKQRNLIPTKEHPYGCSHFQIHLHLLARTSFNIIIYFFKYIMAAEK